MTWIRPVIELMKADRSIDSK